MPRQPTLRDTIPPAIKQILTSTTSTRSSKYLDPLASAIANAVNPRGPQGVNGKHLEVAGAWYPKRVDLHEHIGAQCVTIELKSMKSSQGKNWKNRLEEAVAQSQLLSGVCGGLDDAPSSDIPRRFGYVLAVFDVTDTVWTNILDMHRKALAWGLFDAALTFRVGPAQAVTFDSHRKGMSPESFLRDLRRAA